VSWLSVVPYIFAAVAILFIPGTVVALASRIRGFSLFAVSPAITVTLVSVAAVVAPMAGLRWSPLPVLLLTLLVAVLAFAVATFLAKGKVRKAVVVDWRASGLRWIAVIIAAFLVGRRVVAVIGTPDAFSQTFDNVFHLNAIRYVEDTGSASSLTISALTGGSFYPAAWHDLVALLTNLTNADIPVAVNVINLVVAALVWPLGCMFLAHTVAGARVAVTVAAGILAAAFGSFPLLLLDFGVLYPNFLGNALLPVALGLGIRLLGLGRERSESRTMDGLVLLAILPGIALAHPSSVMAFLALMVPPLLFAWGKTTARLLRAGTAHWLGLLGMAAAFLAGLAGLVIMWQKVRPPEEAAFWPPIETTGRAIGEVLTGSAVGRPVSWAVSILVVAGIVALIVRRSQLWFIGTYLMAAGLFVVVASFPAGPVRMFITGIWYNDPPRLASLLPIVILPLATIGVLACWDRLFFPVIRKILQGVGRTSTPSSVAVAFAHSLVGAVAVGVLAFGTQQANVREAVNAAAPGYQLTKDSPLISADELTLINRLDSKVPEGAVIADNPWNGSALAYAFSGRPVLQPHMHGEMPEGGKKIIEELNEAAVDPSVCTEVERLNVDYVLDFGHREVHGGDHGYDGLDNLALDGVGRLIDSEGEAKLYEITACK
jgi:hypothetical protein